MVCCPVPDAAEFVFAVWFALTAAVADVAFVHLPYLAVFVPAAFCCFPFELAVLVAVSVWLLPVVPPFVVLWDALVLDWELSAALVVLPVLASFSEESSLGDGGCCAGCGALADWACGAFAVAEVSEGGEAGGDDGGGGALDGATNVASSKAANGCESKSGFCVNVEIGDG